MDDRPQRAIESTMIANDELRASVSDELDWDPKVDAEAIAVSADDGEVTLRGTVGSLRERLEAQRAASRVYGVESVQNHLTVKLLGDHGRENAELRGQVLQALVLDATLPKSIDVRVDDGFVTLTGAVEWQYQREEAEFVAGNVTGVVGVVDEVRLNSLDRSPREMARSIKKAFERDAKIDASMLSVDAYDGTVTVTGSVRSWAEHDSAIAAAWAAPGVTNVEDHVLVGF